VLPGAKSLAGAPWSEMAPQGIFWARYYHIQASSSQKFDNRGEKYDLPEAIKENAESVDLAYGVTNNFFVAAVIPVPISSNPRAG